MTRYYCTLFDKNYLLRGLALYASLARFSSPFNLWILCMDEIAYEILSKLNLKHVILVKLCEFEDKVLLKVKPTRTHGEYCWTCNSSLPLYVFRNYPEVNMISLVDSDLYFYSSPEPVFEEFGKNSIMIIPHRFSGNRKEREKKSGIYNVGMQIFRRDKNGLACLKWWRERCLEWCYNRMEGNKMGDQKYLEKFKKLFKGVHILKHIGAGVGTWNVLSYKVTEKEKKIYINDLPLIFFHFCGLKIYYPHPFLLSASLNGYGEVTTARTLIYDQYFKELERQLKQVKKHYANFNLGFVPRPEVVLFLKEEMAEKLIYLKKKLTNVV